MEWIAMWLGYALMAASGAAAVSLVIIAVAALMNEAIRKMLEPYGGFKTFLEFREWYHKRGATPPGEKP